MDEIRRPYRPATAEETREFERVYGLWRAGQERVAAAANIEESQDPEAEWLSISISRARGRNTTDPDESEFADLEISTVDFITEDDAIDLLTKDSANGAQGPIPCPSSPPVTGPVNRRWIRGRPEPASPSKEDDPEEIKSEPLADWPSTRHVQPQTALEPESADVAILKWRGIDIGPATANEAQVVADILAIIRDEAQ